jgi:site-specific DNA-methyltransferase (adenine-specific)
MRTPTSSTFNLDSLPAMREMPDNAFSLAVVDPVYGIDGNAHRRNKSRGKLTVSTDYHKEIWDQEPPPQEYFDQLFRVSIHQVIWGINYFVGIRDLKIGSGRIVWDKVNGSNTYSDCEIAYCSMIDSVRLFRYMWSGMNQGKSMTEGHIMQGNKRLNEKRIHPTQKPVILYDWIYTKFGKGVKNVLDTHLGSGSNRISCHKHKIDFTGYEISNKHHLDQERRWKNYISQTNLNHLV